MNYTNKTWKWKLESVLERYDCVSKPRGMEVRELIGGGYTVQMPAYISLASRKVNLPFMLGEAYWILSGSNRVSDITNYMKTYKNFSDDGVFLRGAYGPKVVDQLGYVVDTLELDYDSRQAVINIWRERPGKSKDIPCTLSMQFLIRNGKLHSVTTMRSQDIVLGFTYDVFTFSMVAMSVKLLLKERGIHVELGDLIVNAGSLHVYEKHYEEAKEWVKSFETDRKIPTAISKLEKAESYDELLRLLKEGADNAKEA